jgi:hypothetical protein
MGLNRSAVPNYKHLMMLWTSIAILRSIIYMLL